MLPASDFVIFLLRKVEGHGPCGFLELLAHRASTEHILDGFRLGPSSRLDHVLFGRTVLVYRH